MEAARKARLGRKWSCFSCGKKFYDLLKPQPICPACNANQEERPAEDPTPAKKTARKKTARKSTKAKKTEKTEAKADK